MRHLLFVLAACGGSEPVAPDAAVPLDTAPDAPPESRYDLACLGQSPPASSGTVTGNVIVIENYLPSPAVGARVELRAGDDTLVEEAITNAAGEFEIAAGDGTYVVITAAATTRAQFDAPLTGEGLLLMVADAAERARWYADVGVPVSSGSRTVLAVVRDCARESVEGATVPGAIYYDVDAMRWDPALTGTTNGFAMIPNAPATLSLAAQVDATVFPAESITAGEDLVLVELTPYR